MFFYLIENTYLSIRGFSYYNQENFTLEIPPMLNLLVFIPS